MNETRNILKSISALIPIIGLALLLLLSPCKVRNFIQAEVGIPQTEVSNKIKTAFSNANCNLYEVATGVLVPEKYSVQSVSDFVLSDFSFTYTEWDASRSAVHSGKTRSHSVSAVPLYILYKNFKNYL
ncbi:hypothetical protein [Mariniflexile sp. AS56]|uniref:hypothetical protein n=1 Tax=Mariniflexile sp. AS56 TaxID=3063957 RepID=UPI0026F15E37|nr:hypothetical protein [Mariniflexile sp. AS56]MDO7174216.1 hypothetical protein [Mariniflexile sp. AS56]